LTELHRFFTTDVETAFESKNNCQVVLDFSDVIYWDVSALLWMVVALHHFRQRSSNESKNLDFKLRLPQPESDASPIDQMSARDRNSLRSADYLRRWRFVEALRNLAEDPDELLVSSQKRYFNIEPKHYYPRTVAGPSGLMEQLVSLRLVEIRNLVDFSVAPESRQIKRELVEARLREFIDHFVAPILSNQCGIDMDVANMFVTHLLWEGLSNAFQHPNARIGMFSISRIGPDKLVLAIADNGESICKTIYEHYRRTQGSALRLPSTYQGHQLDATTRRDLVAHATKEGVSRKWLNPEVNWQEVTLNSELKRQAEIGVGLTHIRDTTVGEFKGNLVIATEGLSITFDTISTDSQHDCDFQDCSFSWPGNLLRIQIPAKDKYPGKDPWGGQVERDTQES
jgi:hypothetical protein